MSCGTGIHNGLKKVVKTKSVMTTRSGAGGRTRLNVWVELRQTAPGSLFWVRYRILIDTVTEVSYLIFEAGPLRKNPTSPKGDIGFLVPVAGLEPARYRYRWILSPLRLPIPSHRHVLGTSYIIADD